jgi:hypothetical protein
MKKLFLNTPEGVKVRRHTVADNDIRFTVPSNAGPDTEAWLHHRKLVAWAKNGAFVWICKGYSA